METRVIVAEVHEMGGGFMVAEVETPKFVLIIWDE